MSAPASSPPEEAPPPRAVGPPSRRRKLFSGVIAVIVVGFLALTVISQWHDLKDADVRFAPGWFALALVAMAIFQALQGEIAGIVLPGLGQPLPRTQTRAIFAAGLIARYVPTGAMTFVVRMAMTEKEGVPRRVVIVGILYEAALAIAGATILTALLLDRLSATAAVAGVLVASVVVVVGFAPAIFGRIADLILVRMKQPRMPQALGLRSAATGVAVCALSFVFYGASVLCVCAGITDVHAGDWPTIVASSAAGFITGILGFALPGGLGAREAGLTGILSLVLPGPLALAVSVVSRLLQTGVELLYAATVNLLERRRVRVTGA